jgi:alpha-tubulin suppressor-like RCC1 family protein
MERRSNTSIHYLWTLQQYFELLCTQHYPREIIYHIITYYYKLFKVKIKCGMNHTILLFDGELYSWGNNEYGQLGLNHSEETDGINKIGLCNIKKISCGIYHSMALNNHGDVYIWGRNPPSKLENSYSECVKLKIVNPTKIPSSYLDPEDPIVKICGNGCHSIIQTKSNQTWLLRLDSGSKNPKTIKISPKNLAGETVNIKKITERNYSTIALTTTNDILVWGSFAWKNDYYIRSFCNDFGQKYSLSDLNIKDVACGESYFAIITKEDIHFYGKFCSNRDGSVGKITFPNIKKIACGINIVTILNNAGEVYKYSHCGHPGCLSPIPCIEKIGLSRIKNIVSQQDTLFAITEMNEIYIRKPLIIKGRVTYTLQKFTF